MTISGNQKPVVKDTTDGIWRRVMLIPFEVQVPTDKIDRKLSAKLQSECDGIFATLMRGLIDWRVNGLIEPEAVRLATSEYRDDSDDMGRFLRQCCVIGEDLPGRPMRIRTSSLFAIFEAWAAASGAFQMNNKQFASAIKAKGFAQKASNGNYWVGVDAVVEAQDIKDGTWTAADDSDASVKGAQPDDDGTGYQWGK
jgi:putative DNA primase/helicase